MLIDFLPAAFAATAAAILMPLAILARRFGHDDDFDGVQKVHEIPTSRLGGVILVIAYFAALAVASRFGPTTLTAAVALAFCSLPVVLIGASEDITRAIHPWHRLAGAVASAVIASYFASGIIARVDLPVLDAWLAYLPFALPLTWFMVAGACNAMNLIDGAHGLAGGVALMMFGGLATMAGYVGDTLILTQTLAMIGAIAGFMVWNYPRGKVFLGDAGAYFLGFMYAELAVQLVARNDAISAWFVIALATYPIVETLYSMYRRKIVLRTESMQPDAGHLHSLIFHQLVMRAHSAQAKESVRRVNARVAPRLWLHGAVCLGAALVLHANTVALIGFTVLYVIAYVVSYRALGGGEARVAAVARVERRESQGNS